MKPSTEVGNEDFNLIVADSIDETVKGLLGQEVLNALHEHLNNFYHVTREELPNHLETLHDALEKTFGVSWKTIERAIAKTLFVNLNLPFIDRSNMTLLEYVEMAKTNRSQHSR